MTGHRLGGLLAQIVTDKHQLVALGLGQGAAALIHTEVGFPARNVPLLAHGLHHLGQLVLAEGLAVVPMQSCQVHDWFDGQVERGVLVAHGRRPPLGILLIVLHRAGLRSMLSGIHTGVRPPSLGFGIYVTSVLTHPLQVLQPRFCYPEPNITPLQGRSMEARAVPKSFCVVEPDEVEQTLWVIAAQQSPFPQNELISKRELHGLVWLISFSFAAEFNLLLFEGLLGALEFLIPGDTVAIPVFFEVPFKSTLVIGQAVGFILRSILLPGIHKERSQVGIQLLARDDINLSCFRRILGDEELPEIAERSLRAPDGFLILLPAELSCSFILVCNKLGRGGIERVLMSSDNALSTLK